MATLYNKTALKKIKKDELVQMFLDQQAKLNDMELATEQKKYVQNLVAETVHSIDKKDKEITKLKENLLSKSEELSNIRREKLELEDIIFEHMKKGTIKYEQKFL